MSRLILYKAMSLDGFITGPNDDKGNPAGDGGMRLQEWLGHGGPEVADYRPTDRPGHPDRAGQAVRRAMDAVLAGNP